LSLAGERSTVMDPSDLDVATAPATIADLPFFVAGRRPHADVVGRCAAGRLDFASGRELLERVRDFSLGLSALGMTRGDRVALLAESGPDWVIADLAILAAGAVVVPIYPTLAKGQAAFILENSGATLAVVSTAEQLAKLAVAAGTSSGLRAIVSMTAPPDPGAPVPVLAMSDVAARGHQRIVDGWGVARNFQDEARRTRPEDVATIIYTSGTTGEPKGVLLTHANLVANITGVREVLDLDEQDRALSFLPLCHAFERLVIYVYLTCGVSVAFAESLETVARDLLVARPTVLTGVPRVFEKLHDRIVTTACAAGAMKRRIFDWATRLADRRGRALERRQAMSFVERLQSRVADRLVFRKIRDAVGGRLRFAVSGSAPLSPDLGRWFLGIGLPILEGYGLTETSPVLTVVPLESVRFGTVGRALPNVELKVADDGEILARGPNIMAGYYGRPGDTAGVIRDGWFCTGDVGTIDAESYLHITDRKREFIATSGGKKIAPQPIEIALRDDPLVADAVLVGDRRRFTAALLVPDFDVLRGRIGPQGTGGTTLEVTLVARDDVQQMYARIVERVNARLAQFEKIKQFVVLPAPFSIASGELTPTLKVKRRVVEERYRDTIDAMYLAEKP
jgi:long-chain acyl-CoA synthetase